MALTREQYDFLLRDLPAGRVKSRSVSGRSMSYVEAWDIRRTLIRCFGFGGFSGEVLDAQVIGCEKGERNWDVFYQVVFRLTIPSLGAVYTEVAVGSAHLPDKGEALDMAAKTAESDALKRCAANLGTQFGLSLYNGGTTSDIVVRTLGQVEGAVPDSGQAMDDLPNDVADDPEDITGPQALTEEQEAVLGALRSLATEMDNAKRIQAVASLKARYHGSDTLTSGHTTVNGAVLTLAALADNVAAGMYLPAPGHES